MADPVDDVITALTAYARRGMPDDREAARAALKRWVRREIREHAPDPEFYS